MEHFTGSAVQNNVKALRLTRRKFLAGMMAMPGMAVADSAALEPTWLKIRQFELPNPIGNDSSISPMCITKAIVSTLRK
jgi:hypothetical protein